MSGVRIGHRAQTCGLRVLDRGVGKEVPHRRRLPLPVHGIKVCITDDNKTRKGFLADDVFKKQEFIAVAQSIAILVTVKNGRRCGPRQKGERWTVGEVYGNNPMCCR